MRLFTSDLHFGHRNVIEYCDRPYENVEEMNEAIIAQWNSQVTQDDHVFFLGDFGINKRKCLDKELVGQLNGIKYIILGNHDSAFVSGHESGVLKESIINKYLKAGWDGVSLKADIELKDGRNVTLVHLPPSNGIDSRYSKFKLDNDPNRVYLHGHLHGYYRKNCNMIDVCYDGDLKLWTEDDILGFINDERDYIPTRLTDHYKNEECLMLKPFEEEVQKKNLRKVVSKDKELVLYNYTDACTYDRAWNEVTKRSRGIIFEKSTGRIVALPFPKFFNIGEMSETMYENLPNEPYVVTEKMDGSLGIIYNYNGVWNVATRGSFSSEQALRGQKILEKYDMSNVGESLTLLVEIIYPENKIVADYGDDEKLIMLAVNNRDTQTELPRAECVDLCRSMKMCITQSYDHSINQMIELQETLPKDEEGFVVRFESGLRVKIKGREYLRIHKLISQISPLSFWGVMENGKVNCDYLKELPEEYRKEADVIVDELERQYEQIKREVDGAFIKASDKLDIVIGNDKEEKKRLGLYVQHKKPLHGGALFPIYLKQSQAVDRYILKILRPTGNTL